MQAAPIPSQNDSTGLSAPFQFNSKPTSSPQRTLQSFEFLVYLTGQQKRDISYRRHLLIHNDRISLRETSLSLPGVICNPRGLFTSKEKNTLTYSMFKRI